MIKGKLFEVRDVGTNISVLAVAIPLTGIVRGDYCMVITEEKRQQLMAIMGNAGWHGAGIIHYVVHMSAQKCAYDAFEWGSTNRTMFTAHSHIAKHWETLESGDVIDVQYILGESAQPKRPDRLNILAGIVESSDE